jgi:uncharacterized protein YbjT (DUF2867 family)
MNLVTGATGAVERHAVSALTERGPAVWTVSKPSPVCIMTPQRTDTND